jgi:ATP adenylyltransferase
MLFSVQILIVISFRRNVPADHVHALPLPYQHFVCLLGKAPVNDDADLSDYLGMKLLSLLDALFKARISAEMMDESQSKAPKRHTSPSWNLLMTTRAMHLIPRQKEDFDGLKELIQADEEESGVDSLGTLSINALGYAGHLLVKSRGELHALHEYSGGVTEVLRHTGIAPVEDVTTANGS